MQTLSLPLLVQLRKYGRVMHQKVPVLLYPASFPNMFVIAGGSGATFKVYVWLASLIFIIGVQRFVRFQQFPSCFVSRDQAMDIIMAINMGSDDT